MRKVGIVLIILEIIGVISALTVGDGLPTGIFQLLGYFLPGIIGIILYIKGSNKEK